MNKKIRPLSIGNVGSPGGPGPPGNGGVDEFNVSIKVIIRGRG
ncbi:hypothetical protein [Polaribacter sp. Hel1_85]|nr:hypothetical protein [Polaribacter sp. Hel1_85]